jgi:hypothetical protein
MHYRFATTGPYHRASPVEGTAETASTAIAPWVESEDAGDRILFYVFRRFLGKKIPPCRGARLAPFMRKQRFLVFLLPELSLFIDQWVE